MTTASPNPQPDLVPASNPSDRTPALRQQLIDCWIAVSNTGGAAGFPFPPVDSHDVAPVADQLIARLHPDRLRLLLALAHHDHTLLGWVALATPPAGWSATGPPSSTCRPTQPTAAAASARH
jgi:hypothetical protein